MDNQNNIQMNFILAGAKEAAQEIQRLRDELDKLKQNKVGSNGIADQLQKDLSSANKVVAAEVEKINKQLEIEVNPTKLVQGYKQAIATATTEAEKFHRLFKDTGNVDYQQKSIQAAAQVRQLTDEYNKFNRTLGLTPGLLSNIGTEFKRHLGFALTGLGVGAAIGGIYGALNDITKLDEAFNQLRTVIPQTEENQVTFNQAIEDSFHLAQKYGTAIKDVTDSLRLMGRGYHDLSQTEKLSEIALKLGVADNFNPELATRTIEGVVGAYGKQANSVAFATHVMDAMTKVSHTAQVSAQDLAESLLRSAAAAHTVGISFDELNAMTAVIARNTGLGGATIGQGIKSIVNSIHSSKAIESLEEMGVQVYKIGNDGEKEFRKISDVLLDVAIKAKSTDQNFEALFRNLAGGKFQVTKLSAMLDPNEYLRVLGNSINSSGFTDKQLEIQMDTIKRKTETLKASFEEMLVTGGNESGFKNELKNILDVLNQVLKGLNNINPVVWDTVGGITKFAVAFVALRTAVNFANSSYDLLKGSIIRTTAAQEALNVATTANPWGALAKLIVLAGTALATYAYFAGEAATAQEKASQIADTAIRAKASEIEMTKQQTAYMETLGNSYVSLQAALQQVGDNEEKAAEIKRTMGTVSEQLANIVGKEAADRILASDDVIGAITQEQAVHNEKTIKMQQELDNLRETQTKLANDTIAMVNERISAINQEAIAFDKAANSIGEALGRMDEMMFKHLRNKANYLNGLADGGIKDEWKLAGIEVPEGQDISAVTDQIKKEADEATKQADEIKANALNYWSEKGRVALGTLYTPGSYSTTPVSTGEISNDGSKGKSKGSSKSNGSSYAPDSSQQIEKLWANHQVSFMLSDAKIKADDYSAALEKLNTQQELFGFTAENSAQKIQLMKDRMQQLTNENTSMQTLADSYEQQANNMIASSQAAVDALNQQKTSWSSLSTQEKKDFAEAYGDYVKDQKLLVRLLDLSEKLKTEIANNKRQISGLGNDVTKEEFKTPEQLYDNNMKDISYDESHAIAGLGYKANDTDKLPIQLEAAVKRLTLAQNELNRVKEKYGDGSEQYKKQQQAADSLTTEVEKLGNTLHDKVTEGLYSITSQFIIQGNSWKNIWKNLWQGLADDALKALLKIKNDSPSLLTQVFSLFGGGGTVKKSHTGENITSVAPKMHDGGNVSIGTNQLKDDEVLRTLQVGERVLSKDANQSFTGMMAGFKELSKPTEYVPHFKNPELAKQVINVQRGKDEEMIAELKQSNTIMSAMLSHLMSGQGNSGNTTVVPIVTKVSANDVLEVIQQNPSQFQSIMNQQQSRGWR
jgi:TP901 family phage tail tape measure protein